MLYLFRIPFASIIRSYSMAKMWHILAMECTVLTDLDIYTGFIPTQLMKKHQWLLLQFIVFLMTDAKGVRNM